MRGWVTEQVDTHAHAHTRTRAHAHTHTHTRMSTHARTCLRSRVVVVVTVTLLYSRSFRCRLSASCAVRFSTKRSTPVLQMDLHRSRSSQSVSQVVVSMLHFFMFVFVPYKVIAFVLWCLECAWHAQPNIAEF